MRKFKAAAAIILCAATVASFGGCLKYTSNIYSTVSTTAGEEEETKKTSTSYNYGEYSTYNYGEITTAESNTVVIISPDSTTVEDTTAAGTEATTAAQQTAVTTTQAAQTSTNPSQWTKSQIISYTQNAINKTKNYTAAITAYHKESMEATVTSCPGGSLVKNTANSIISSAIKPTDQTLNFSNGKAVSSEGETLQMLLPKDKACTIPETSVATATASKSGSTITVNIKLKDEKATYTTKPTANSQCFGYLDPSTVDLSMITLNTFDTDYTGSTMEVKINADTGYVTNAVYTIPVDISAAGKAMGISASVEVSAKQVEIWTINW